MARDPAREAPQRAPIRACAASGDRAMALRQFHAGRTVLRRERGVEPDAETRALYLSLLSEEEPAGTAADPRGDATVTIVFTDIEGSTEIAERLGDERWAQEAGRARPGHPPPCGGQRGREGKSQGDGLVLTPRSARGALRFAVAVQRELAEEATGEALRVRIVLHTGEAVRRGEDLLGRAVITAARIAGECRGARSASRAWCGPWRGASAISTLDAGREVRLKGLSEPEWLYRLRWDVRDASVTGAA